MHLAPMPGRIYLTPSPRVAFDYMRLRQKWPDYRGAVLEVDLPTNADVLVDEDCVGQAIAIYFDKLRTGPGWRYDASSLKSACGFGSIEAEWSPDNVAGHMELLGEIAALAAEVVPKRDLAFLKSGRGTVRMFAKVGKQVSPRLGTALTYSMLDLGANAAVKSPVRARAGWVFDGLPSEPGSGRVDRAFAVATYYSGGALVGKNRLPPVLALASAAWIR